MSDTIPVTVVTGFLGAGKSTLLERWVTERPRGETAVILNELGEVGIDGALLASRVTRLREITGGCICCASQLELAAALAELADAEPAPERVLVETSGAASPAGVVRALLRGRASERLRLDGIVTVVDATRADATLRRDLAVEQLAFADVVVLSHAEGCAPDALAALEARLVTHAPAAVMCRSRRGALDGADTTLEALLDRRADGLRLFPDAATSHSPIDAVSMIHPGELDDDRFAAWVERALGAVEARVLRVKGILAMRGVDARVIVQGVGESIEVTVGRPWAEATRDSRLVVLGLGLDADRLEAGFAACAARPEPA